MTVTKEDLLKTQRCNVNSPLQGFFNFFLFFERELQESVHQMFDTFCPSMSEEVETRKRERHFSSDALSTNEWTAGREMSHCLNTETLSSRFECPIAAA